jgi:hypothetical protein
MESFSNRKQPLKPKSTQGQEGARPRLVVAEANRTSFIFLNMFKKVLDRLTNPQYAARVERVQIQRRPQMNIEIVTYMLYLAITIGLTIWVAHTLHTNGRIFLVDVFHGNEPLADSVNHLLVVGFYLINLGFVSLALKLGYEITTPKEGIEALSVKVGTVLLVLGGMHFFNLFIFSRMRRRATMQHGQPPVYPDAFTPVEEV